jgi:hypothetical protein
LSIFQALLYLNMTFSAAVKLHEFKEAEDSHDATIRLYLLFFSSLTISAYCALC